MVRTCPNVTSIGKSPARTYRIDGFLVQVPHCAGLGLVCAELGLIRIMLYQLLLSLLRIDYTECKVYTSKYNFNFTRQL